MKNYKYYYYREVDRNDKRNESEKNPPTGVYDNRVDDDSVENVMARKGGRLGNRR